MDACFAGFPLSCRVLDRFSDLVAAVFYQRFGGNAMTAMRRQRP
jgi:hypothetical protein